MARYKITFDMPVRLAAGDRAMAIAGRLDAALQGLATRGVTDPELATHRVRRTRLRSVTVTMTVRAPDASRALTLGFDALRSALGRDARAWDVPGTGVSVVPVTPAAPPRPTVASIRAARARAARSGLVRAGYLLSHSDSPVARWAGWPGDAWLDRRSRAGPAEHAWAQRFEALLSPVQAGAPWRSTDDLNAEALADVLRDGPQLPQAAFRHLALAGHRLRPWPDAVAALRRLAGRFTVVALSNGNLSMLTDLFAAGGLTWHSVISGELVHAYKPDPAVYRFALDRLALDPSRTLMVAAHPWDLRAARTHGLRTAYVERAGEGQLDPSDRFDITVPDLAGLAARLVDEP